MLCPLKKNRTRTKSITIPYKTIVIRARKTILKKRKMKKTHTVQPVSNVRTLFTYL